MSGRNKTRQENEKWYDENVAPALADLARQCKERGMSFLAMVGNDDDSYQTRLALDLNSPALRLALYAMHAKGNVDALIAAVIKDAESRGGVDFSIYLTNLKRYGETLERGGF